MDLFSVLLLKAAIVMVLVRETLEQKVNITRGPSYEHPLRTSDLMCYFCYNEGKSDNCVTMSNTSLIQVVRCKKEETFCKVRRLETKGELTTLDRHCAQYCEPGCSAGIINEECVSCCQGSFCNVGNSGATTVGRPISSPMTILLLLPPVLLLASAVPYSHSH